MNKPLPAICIDIETANADSRYVDAAIENWTPPANIKDPAKLKARYNEARIKLAEKSALSDAAPIICVALYDSDGHMTTTRFEQSEESILQTLSNFLRDSVSAGTELVGHNILGFDLPKLRLAYLRHGLQLPLCLRPPTTQHRQPVFDLMREFRYFSAEHYNSRYVSLKTVLETLGIERPDDIDGTDVPKAYAEGRHNEILNHTWLDVELTMRAYKMLTGQV